MVTLVSTVGCGKSSKETNANKEVSVETKTEAKSENSSGNINGTYDLDEVKERTITIADRMGENHIMGRTEKIFADSLKELSGGKITSSLYLNGEIETGSTHIKDGYEMGLMDAGRAQLELMGFYGYKEGTVFGLPYLFENREHFWKFADSELGDKVLEDIAKMDWSYVPLVYIEEGARHFFTTDEIKSYHDLAKTKIRVQQSDIYVGLVEAFGASATPMAWPEVYTGLSTGVVDGAENPYSGYDSYLLNEVAPYILEDGHIFAGGTFGVSKNVWDDLNDTEKAIFKEAAKMASDYNRKQIAADEEEIKEKLIKSGVTIIQMTEEEKAEVYELVKPMYKKFAVDYLELVDEIKALK
jgi:TRAP-type C4-dicarboxylate transport system substrate-binding protein